MIEAKQSKQDKKNKFDLGADNVLKTFLTILIPTLIAQIIAGTFVVFDTFFVSKGFQASALGQGIGNIDFHGTAYSALGPAAVSYATPYTFFLIGVGLMIGAGLASIMTKAKANGDNVAVQNSMNSYLPLSIIFGISLMVILLIFAKVFVWFGSGFQKDYIDSWFNNPMLNPDWGAGWANATSAPTDPKQFADMYQQVNGHILSQSSWYLRIQAFGAIPYVYMTGGVIMLRVQGKAQYATSFSAIGLIINIFLDFLFIIVLKMNVVGAAISTVIGQYATATAYYIYFQYKAEVRANRLNWKFATSNVAEVSKSGISIMMLQVLTGLVLIVFTFSIGVSNYGEMYAVTNYTAVYQGFNAIFIFLNLVVIGIAQSMAPILTYNSEKGDVDKVKKARLYGMGSSLVFSLIAAILIVIFSKQVIGVFYTVNGTSADYITSGYLGTQGQGTVVYTNGMSIASKVTRTLFLTFPIAVMINVSGTYLQAIGEDKKSSVLLFGKIITLVPLVIIFILLPEFYSGAWSFLDASGNAISGIDIYIDIDANLNMFLALPTTDILLFIILVVFLIGTEKKVIKPMNK